MAPKVGDLETRTLETFSVVLATPEMARDEATLASNATVVWLDRDVRASTNDIKELLAKAVGALPRDVKVVRHFLEAFLITFIHGHHCVRATMLFAGSARLRVRAWSLESHAEHVDMRYHICLCLENIPLYAWNEHTIAIAIRHVCSLDYIEPASLLKQNTESLACWAWTRCPSRIPLVNWVTLPARASPVPETGRRGLERRVIIHLNIIEDHTGDTVQARELVFRLGIIDGDSSARYRRSDPRRNGDRDDEDRDRCGRNDGRASIGWRERVRSLSRHTRSRGDGRDDRDAGRQTHVQDGRRCRAATEAAATPTAAMAPTVPTSPHAQQLLLLEEVGAGNTLDVLPPDAEVASDPLELQRAPALLAMMQEPPEAEDDLSRGRSPTRSSSPRTSRRRSIALCTPPATLLTPSSPKSILPPSPRSPKRASAPARFSSSARASCLPLQARALLPASCCPLTASARRFTHQVSSPPAPVLRAPARHLWGQ